MFLPLINQFTREELNNQQNKLTYKHDTVFINILSGSRSETCCVRKQESSTSSTSGRNQRKEGQQWKTEKNSQTDPSSNTLLKTIVEK